MDKKGVSMSMQMVMLGLLTMAIIVLLIYIVTKGGGQTDAILSSTDVPGFA